MGQCDTIRWEQLTSYLKMKTNSLDQSYRSKYNVQIVIMVILILLNSSTKTFYYEFLVVLYSKTSQ